MFVDLNNILQLQNDNKVLDETKKFVLVTDTQMTSGSFLLFHFISMYLRRNQSVCLLALENNLQHYVNVFRKIVSKNRGTFVGVLTLLFKNTGN